MKPAQKKISRYFFIGSLFLFFGIAFFLVDFAISQEPAVTPPTELFISEYVEGLSNNKALEIYNPTASAVDLAAGNYKVEFYFNGSLTPGTTASLSGTLAASDVFVFADHEANSAILNIADQQSSATFFNGNDAVVLKKGGSIIDVIGQIGVNPGIEWGSGLVSTADNTLVRKCEVTTGDNDGTNVFDPAVEWEGYPQNDSYLGSHGFCPPTATPTSSPTPTPTETPTSTPTSTPTPISTPEPTATPSPIPTETSIPTLTPQPTSTEFPTPTSSPSPYPPFPQPPFKQFFEKQLRNFLSRLFSIFHPF